jgi:hypothetical protein
MSVERNDDELSDRHEIVKGSAVTHTLRVVNPNDVDLIIGVRSGDAGANFGVSARDNASRLLPDGWYDIYIVYTDEPQNLYQGNAFRISHGTTEITETKNFSFDKREVE